VDITEVYREADVVVIPRNKPFRMAFPLRIVESLVMRKPLIVTTVCDMHKLIQGCGIAVEPHSPERLAEAMIELAANEKLYRECQENCAIRAVDYDSRVSLGQLRTELIEAID
jgi:glycosyltransferase involved in cell wall biosynthesis